MLATMGLIFAIALLVVMIIKGIDMICATVITAVIILLSISSACPTVFLPHFPAAPAVSLLPGS